MERMTDFPPERGRLQRIARQAMTQHDLLPDFSASALAQANGATAAAEAGPDIRDLRDRLWCSIDNDDSRDLDQLSVAEQLPDGRVRIMVAIADVDAAITAGSPIDDHARANTTSVYTVAALFPMLPEHFSTDLSSLGEAQERLAIVVSMTLDATGAIVESDVYRATVLNRAKLAYNGVTAWLQGDAPPPARLAAVPGLDEQLRVQDRTAQLMRKRRQTLGALSLHTLETRPVFDGDSITDLRPDDTNRAKELIEDFMIAANGVTARYQEQHGFASIRRVLQSPQRWNRIVEIAGALGERLPAEPSAPALEQFLISRRKAAPATFPDLSLSLVKLLGAGEYAVKRPGGPTEGHFGLAVDDYAHSTAPNRRYPDLVTQRLLKAAIARRESPYSVDELTWLAAHCTLQQNNAAKVERQVRKSAAALFLTSRIHERFDAIVTGASAKGTWVRTLRPPVEGRVVQGAEGLDVGDRVQVVLVRTDVERGFIDFARG